MTPMQSKPITLSSPIERQSGAKVEQLTLRKPTAGELRGLSIRDLLTSDVDATLRLIPRIATPSITAAEADSLDPADLAALSNEVIDFLLSKAQREKADQLLAAMT